MKATIEGVLNAPKKFNMSALYNTVWPLIEADTQFTPHLANVRKWIGKKNYKLLGNAILRNAFLIEPMLTRGGATKMRMRWLSALENDQRYCSYEECLLIAADLVRDLANSWLNDASHLESLILSLNHRMTPHEAALDYVQVIAPNDYTSRIHRRGNLSWVCTETTLRTLKLRKFLTDRETSPDVKLFKKVLDKIRVKAYLTDRVQTGEHQTNREKRWETPPHSVHFATRQLAMAIEEKLVTQICAFQGFPEQARAALQAQNVLPEQLETYRCPITQDPLSFEQFFDELMNPVQGRSSFQVAHLNPLKLDDPENEARGHMAENISWISADGNRIQGSMSLADIRALLRRIAKNYEALGLAEEETPKAEPPQA